MMGSLLANRRTSVAVRINPWDTPYESSRTLVEVYHSYPPNSNTSDKVIIHLTDIFGLPLLQNKLYVYRILHPAIGGVPSSLGF